MADTTWTDSLHGTEEWTPTPASEYEMYDAEAGLEAMEIAEDVEYYWERKTLEALAENGKISGYSRSKRAVAPGFGKLDGWQVQRLLDWGVIEKKVLYDAGHPLQDRFNATKKTVYALTETGAALAKMVDFPED